MIATLTILYEVKNIEIINLKKTNAFQFPVLHDNEKTILRFRIVTQAKSSFKRSLFKKMIDPFPIKI